MNRRTFIQQLGCITGAAAVGAAPAAHARQSGGIHGHTRAVLIDTTLCVGCRACEQACNEVNCDLPRIARDRFKDDSVFEHRRRMDAATYTVVNRYHPEGAAAPVFVKFQCLHCLEPACVSACLVRALRRDRSGAVTYTEKNCIGCRYCMVACPFQVPAYEYGKALTPQVRKCTFCFDTHLARGEAPACVAACPMRVMTFGPRNELIALGRERMRKHPRRYIPHIYGEHEAGGTAWLYLASAPFEQLDLPQLGYHPVPGYTEPIQHALFKWFAPPLGLFAVLTGLMWYSRRKAKQPEEDA